MKYLYLYFVDIIRDTKLSVNSVDIKEKEEVIKSERKLTSNKHEPADTKITNVRSGDIVVINKLHSHSTASTAQVHLVNMLVSSSICLLLSLCMQ
jgi:hypothetical protein